jgi:hypothetical protein
MYLASRDKVFLLAQMTFGNVSLDDFKGKDVAEAPNPSLDVFVVFKSAVRVIKGRLCASTDRLSN